MSVRYEARACWKADWEGVSMARSMDSGNVVYDLSVSVVSITDFLDLSGAQAACLVFQLWQR